MWGEMSYSRVRKESQTHWSEIGGDKEAKVSVTEAKITENSEKQYLTQCHEEVQENELWEEKSVEICMGLSVSEGNFT